MVVRLRRPASRAISLLLNLWELLVVDALRSWARHLLAMAPAAGSIALVLVLVGLGGLGTVVLESVAAAQARDATSLHVYVRDDATPGQLDALRARLAADPSVQRADFVSKADALRAALGRPGMRDLIDQAEGNPLPAGFEVRVASLAAVGSLAQRVADDPAVDPEHPTSYEAGAYRSLQGIIRTATLATLAGVALLTLIAAGVTTSAIRAVAVAREDEVRTMRLVGASGWMIRGPFVLEGALTGSAGGIVAASLLVALCWALKGQSRMALSDVLPGVSALVAGVDAALLLPLGAGFGSASALLGLRRHRI